MPYNLQCGNACYAVMVVTRLRVHVLITSLQQGLTSNHTTKETRRAEEKMPFGRKAKPKPAKSQSGTPQLIRIVPRGTQYSDKPAPAQPRPLSLDFDAVEEQSDERFQPLDESSKIVKSKSVDFQRPAKDRLAVEVDAHPFATQERRRRRKLTPPAPSAEQRGLSPPASPGNRQTPSPPTGQKKPASPRHRVVHVQIVPLMKPVNLQEGNPMPSNGSAQPQNFYSPHKSHSPERREENIRSKSFDVAAHDRREAFRHHHHVPRDELEKLREHRKNQPIAPPPYQPKTNAQSPRPRPNIQIVPLMSPVDKTPTISPPKSAPAQRERHRKIVASKSLDFEVPAKQKPMPSLSPDPTRYSSRPPAWTEHPYKQPSPLSEPLGRSPVVVENRRAPQGKRPEGKLARMTALDGNPAPMNVRKPVKAQYGGLGPAPVSYS